MVAAQIRAVLDDLPVAAVKTGMLGTTAVIGRSAAWPRPAIFPGWWWTR